MFEFEVPATKSPIKHIIPADGWWIAVKPDNEDMPDVSTVEKARHTDIYKVIAFAVLESNAVVPLFYNEVWQCIETPNDSICDEHYGYELHNDAETSFQNAYYNGQDAFKLYKED